MQKSTVFQNAVFLALAIIAMIFAHGCGKQGRELSPITGQVSYQGKPLRFGSVMIEHKYGQPATAAIQPDGTFVIATLGEGEGAAAGKHRVRIACFEAQDPAGKVGHDPPVKLGKSLIPEKYTSFDSSGLTITVRSDKNHPLILNLTP